MSEKTEADDGMATGATADANVTVAIDTKQTPSAVRLLQMIVAREVRTVVRTRTFLLFGLTLTAVLLGVAWVSGGLDAGYVPTTVDMLTPLELLVPVIAIAFGYRAVLGDERRGELDVLETYPVNAWQIVLGVYLGRAAGLVVTVLVPLSIVGAAVGLSDTDGSSIYATHSGVDSPILFVRLIVLALLLALVVLAVAIAISAVASAARSALALAVVALIVLLVGLDLLLVYGLSTGFVSDSALLQIIAISPISAFRGLVLESVVIVAAGTGPQTAAPVTSILSLFVWGISSLAVATWSVRRS
ncbi:ABC transporter permease [Natronolimnohabitans innermongolicus]|uniref:Copper ABC transporter permease n=1 Tax=Natronolimnohabitans innermongolicus JCM 12255 TaxID=1227499 RepID=L9WRU2_9EURY|nr:ABC transporter permease subunit [Natronolimnohabitans innermongolicus]ELY51003.1 copper ABC transporter permease [Natronolimnohabitans innermongolicus JCM 12255]